jgi:uncharacterized membrane protein
MLNKKDLLVTNHPINSYGTSHRTKTHDTRNLTLCLCSFRRNIVTVLGPLSARIVQYSRSLLIKRNTPRIARHPQSIFSMKLFLLLLLLLPLFVQARHRRDDAKGQHERPEQQHSRRVQQEPEVLIVSCAGGASFRLDPSFIPTLECSIVLSSLIISYDSYQPVNRTQTHQN